ncbi:hypothetical protein CLPUN_25020 [Clostridium puniceum]|uniref:Uncharacterized protein n=1 Tax=Clostridium puniceum TaxID=29367 RepID=A0A1S8TH10_9CLOT|nr:hypothetical protein CLPUN_25020 [Clostridium puniceum]
MLDLKELGFRIYNSNRPAQVPYDRKKFIKVTYLWVHEWN